MKKRRKSWISSTLQAPVLVVIPFFIVSGFFTIEAGVSLYGSDLFRLGADLSPPGAHLLLAGLGRTDEELERREAPRISEEAVTEQKGGSDELPEPLRLLTRGWNTNWSTRTIEFNELQHGGPPRDGIPSIDNPTFVSVEVASTWLAPNEPVIFTQIEDDTRAYPLQILIWHEIVNDRVGGIPVLVTFCPLCNASILYNRRLEGKEFEFGTSGLLRNSDLVMYDRSTESLWQQLTGEAIVGDLAGKRLDIIPSSIASFGDFSNQYPKGEVLSRETGYQRRYGENPYTGYESIDQNPFLFKGELDHRLKPMERVVAVSLITAEGKSIDVAYPFRLLSQKGVINDSVEGIDLVVFYTPGTSSALSSSSISEGTDVGASGVYSPQQKGEKLIFVKKGDNIQDIQSGSRWNIFGLAIEGSLEGVKLTPIPHGDFFWFAWAAFKPDTIIYR